MKLERRLTKDELRELAEGGSITVRTPRGPPMTIRAPRGVFYVESELMKK